MTETSEQLLRDIRELLSVVAEALRPQYETAVLDRLGPRAKEFRSAVGSASQWSAVMLMDGTRSQSSICQQTKMDAGYMSRFVKKLVASGFMEEASGNPKCAFTNSELQAIRRASNAE